MAEGPVYTPTFGDDLWRDLEGLLDIFAGVKPEKKNLTLLWFCDFEPLAILFQIQILCLIGYSQNQKAHLSANGNPLPAMSIPV